VLDERNGLMMESAQRDIGLHTMLHSTGSRAAHAVAAGTEVSEAILLDTTVISHI
jgi:hypothetical protein